MEIENAIFQDMGSFGKGTFFKMAMKIFGFLFGRMLKIPQNGCSFVSY